MKKFFALAIMAAASLFAISSCQKMPEQPHTDTVVIYSVIPQLESEAGNLTVTVYASTDWTIEGEGWLSVSPASGKKGISETVLTYSANTTGAPRTTNLNLKAGSYTHTQKVTQK